MADEGQAAAPAAKKRGPMRMIVIAALVLVLAGGGYFWKTQQAAHSESPAQQEMAKADLYLPLDPPFVVNFKDGESLRYLQVTVTLMSHDPKAIETAKNADPVIRDALVSLFSNQEYSVISSADGRRKLQQQALETVQKIVKERTGKPGMEALYFTSFVMQ